MDIRGYKEEDLQEIKKLIAKIYKTDKGSLDYYVSNTIKNKINVIVAEENKKIIGIGSIWSNKFHNNADYMGINVLKEFRRKGVGQEIFMTLEGYCNKKKIQCALKSDNSEGSCFIKKLGFEMVRRTFEPIYDLSKDLKFDMKISMPDHFIIRSISEIENYEDKCKVVNLYKQIYIRNHTFNKVSSLNDDQWKSIIFKDLYAEGSFMILDNNKIIALSLIYYGEDKGILELGLRGTEQDYKHLEKNLILYVLSKQINYAKQNNYLFIQDEIDDCDSGAMVMAEFLNLDKLVSWDTYLKNRKNYKERKGGII